MKITVEPNPATPGAVITICIDDLAGAALPVQLRMDCTPAQEPVIELPELDADNRCVTHKLPDDIVGLTIVDQSGQAADLPVPIDAE